MIWGTPWYPFRKPLNDWETAWIWERGWIDEIFIWIVTVAKFGQKRWPTQKLRCRCRTGARMLVQFALLISTWIAAVQCLATVEALAKCGEGKPGRGMRFTQKYSMDHGSQHIAGNLEEYWIILLQKRFLWGKIVDWRGGLSSST